MALSQQIGAEQQNLFPFQLSPERELRHFLRLSFLQRIFSSSRLILTEKQEVSYLRQDLIRVADLLQTYLFRRVHFMLGTLFQPVQAQVRLERWLTIRATSSRKHFLHSLLRSLVFQMFPTQVKYSSDMRLTSRLSSMPTHTFSSTRKTSLKRQRLRCHLMICIQRLRKADFRNSISLSRQTFRVA